MVIDTSALLAILKVEPDAEALIARLSLAGPRRLSTATLLETRLVIERHLLHLLRRHIGRRTDA